MTQFTSDEAYQNYILPGVSRTFALTIPQLPTDLCKVVSNGYLLCRIADTIEDEPCLTLSQKKRFSQEFTKVVAGEYEPNLLSKSLYPLLSDSTLATEKDLIFNLVSVIRLTHSFNPNQRDALYKCVKIMAKGMAEFQQNSSLNGLNSLVEMDRYCYYVAGVVGEMLTELFCDYSPEIAHNKKLLQHLAISFGQALQMTNIIKDIWEDRQRGVCWLPQDIFTPFELKNLTPNTYSPAFGDGLTKLIAIANNHMHNALRYILLIPASETGIRRFCLWALGMAILTLRRVLKHKDFSKGQQVKISRRSVKTTILISNLVTSNNTSLRVLFYLLTRNIPEKPDKF
ncbi:MAG: phytoene/squalene synthase family protein [Candidatus Marithrix sp.]|nr:phytoene/squalene synthase family protein [Candidatus Marithrix sp.]